MLNQKTPVRYDVAAFGELVIDMVPAGQAGGASLYAAKPGGAPGNVAAGIARLGLRAAMLGKVGHGYFGNLLIQTLERAGVDANAIVRSANEVTSLAIVNANLRGEPEFTLYREGCADASYGPEEVATDVVRSCRVLHVGSLSLATPASARSQRAAVGLAREAGALVSTDVNFRPALWRDVEAMIATGREAVASANIVKVSEEELLALTGIAGIAEGAKALWHPELRILAVTRGAMGAELFTKSLRVAIPGFAVEVVDTVGCGDAFMASMLAGVIATGGAELDAERLFAIGRAACAAGAVMAGVSGAMEHMPLPREIAALVNTPSLRARTEPLKCQPPRR
jgi:fructokinase